MKDLKLALGMNFPFSPPCHILSMVWGPTRYYLPCCITQVLDPEHKESLGIALLGPVITNHLWDSNFNVIKMKYLIPPSHFQKLNDTVPSE